MINYIRHDEEFYFLAKLVSGESIIGNGFAIEEGGSTQIYVTDPVEVQVVTRQLGDTNKGVKGVSMNKWMEFSDEDFFIINEKDIMSIAGLSQEMIYMYELFIKKSPDKENIKDVIDEKKVDMDSEMGLKGRVNEVRKKLEDLYKKS
jgi:hypothetical protein